MMNNPKILAFCAFFALLSPHLYAQTVFEGFVDGEVYVQVKADFRMETRFHSPELDYKRHLTFLTLFESRFGIEKAQSSFYFAQTEQLRRTFRVQFSKMQLVEELIEALNKRPEVEFAEKIPLVSTYHTPNDLGADNIAPGQYALHLTQAQDAWTIDRGNPAVVVAIVDNAVQGSHNDLNAVAGRDVADADNNPDPPGPTTILDHGTHVAGISGATTNNGLNVASIGYNTSIMPIKCTRDTSTTTRLSHAYEGVAWAASNGAEVINMSWGSFNGCGVCGTIIANALSSGSILVAAAGNDALDTTSFPAQYPGVIAVANTNINDMKSGSSNFGTWIDVSAPGSSIQSLVPFNGVGSKGGTSMASPYVAGLIGLALSARDVYAPAMSNADVVNCVLCTADDIDADNPFFAGQLGSGRVNAYEALKCIVGCTAVYVEPTTTYSGGAVRYRQASSEVRSDVTCDGCELTHNSGGFIRLTPPFHVKSGNIYHGFIEGCSASKPAMASSEAATESRNLVSTNLKTGFSIFPNPTSADFTISLGLETESLLHIQLVDQLGQLVRTVAAAEMRPSGIHSFSVTGADLESSVYYVRVQTDGAVQTRAVVITR